MHIRECRSTHFCRISGQGQCKPNDSWFFVTLVKTTKSASKLITVHGLNKSAWIESDTCTHDPKLLYYIERVSGLLTGND